MNLANEANLPDLAKMFSFYTKHLKMRCSQCRFKSFQNQIKFSNENFDVFMGFLILTELGKLGKFASSV